MIQRIDIVQSHADDNDVDVIATIEFDGTGIRVIKDTPDGYTESFLNRGFNYDGVDYRRERPGEMFAIIPHYVSGRQVFATKPYTV